MFYKDKYQTHMSDIVIKVEKLSKKYKLGVVSNTTLFRDLQSWWARLRGREDPHSKIASNEQINTGDFWALKDVSFEIYAGDRVAFIGKNGAGKSTLLKILSQITTPTEGVAKMKGKVSSLLEVGTGFHPELTGRENIYLNGAILGMKKKEIDAKLDAIIDFCGIECHIDTPIKRYSSGMQVRLGFAVASHLNCDILIADEVLAVGDIEFQKKAISKMNNLSTSEGRTILFVSHNLLAVRNLCNKGFLLDKGRLVFSSDNINESIKKYIQIGDANKEFIAYQNKELVEGFKLNSVLINGSASRYVQYTLGEKLKIEFIGNIKKTMPLCVEMRIKNEMGARVAYYNRGHFTKIEDTKEGDFHIIEELSIPNIITGSYTVDLYVSSPYTLMLLAYIENAFVINAIGVQTISGVSLLYNDTGFIKID